MYSPPLHFPSIQAPVAPLAVPFSSSHTSSSSSCLRIPTSSSPSVPFSPHPAFLFNFVQSGQPLFSSSPFQSTELFPSYSPARLPSQFLHYISSSVTISVPVYIHTCLSHPSSLTLSAPYSTLTESPSQSQYTSFLILPASTNIFPHPPSASSTSLSLSLVLIPPSFTPAFNFVHSSTCIFQFAPDRYNLVFGIN